MTAATDLHFPSEGPLTLSEQARRIRRRWRTLLTVWILTLLAALLLGLAMPRAYTASTEVRVDPLTTVVTASPSSVQQVDIDTERKIASSQEVIQQAAESEEHLTADQLRSQVSVSSDLGTSILTFTARAGTPEQAVTLADTLAQAYLTQRSATVETAVRQALSRLDEQINLLTAQGPPPEAQIRELRQIQARAMTASRYPGAIITSGSSTVAVASPDLPYYLAAGLLGGLLLGSAAAMVRDRWDPRVRYADRAADELGLMVLPITRLTSVEQMALLRRRRHLASGQELRSTAVLCLPEDRHRAQRLGQVLELRGKGTLSILAIEEADGSTVEHADGCSAVLLVISPRTSRARVRHLIDSCRRAWWEPEAVILVR